MSIRLRLTLWYTSILAIVLLIFGTALYYLLTFALLSSIDRQLIDTADRVAASARAGLNLYYMEKLAQLPVVSASSAPGLFVQVYHVDSGQIIQRSDSLGDAALPLDEAILSTTLSGHNDRRTAQAGSSALRLFSTPVIIGEQVEGVVQTGISLAQLYQTQRQLLAILLAVGVLALAISAGLGALLARAALRPIDEITQTALAISRTEHLSRRLEVKGPHDEVGRLVSTFNEMLARLEILFRTQERFIADVSHELRTPLTTIQGSVDLLHRAAADGLEAEQEILAAIEGEVSRMSRLVADLLLSARVDAGIRLETRPVELDTLLLEVYRQARVMSDGVDVRLGHEDQASVQGDADRLRQLFLNLVDNALKYTPSGGQVMLSLFNEEDWVRVTVADTGLGIPAEDLEPGPNGVPMIFERFYRVDQARTRMRGGAGLGLGIAHWIAQAHGGQILVESEPGQGSTFTVRLPSQP